MTPREAYARRIEELTRDRARQESRSSAAGYTQLGLAAVALGWLLLRLHHYSKVDLLVLLLVGAFVVLAVLHERWIRAANCDSRSIRFYQQGLARLDGTWAGTGNSGTHLMPAEDLCAQDLDLFGPASLFELLCTARTRAGEQELARWLLAAAPPEEVLARQGAALDLKDRLEFRERLALEGEDVKLGVHPAALIAWGEGGDLFAGSAKPVTIAAAVFVLAVLWVLSVLAWKVWGVSGYVPFAMTVVNASISRWLHRRLPDAVHAAEDAGHDLALLSGVLQRFEAEKFESPRLLALQASLTSGGTASGAIAKLNRWVEFLESAHNLFVRVFDPVVFYRLQFLLAAERWRARHGKSLQLWLDSVGQLEALSALGAYTFERPDHVFPEFVTDAPWFEAKALSHPLLDKEHAVTNDLLMNRDTQFLMISGPNMAGKSTFLRGIGINAVLAQCGAPVCAASLKMSPLTVAASIHVTDSLQQGISRFYAEIRRLKHILDATGGAAPVLFLLDELLSGTNSHDRLIGTRSVVLRLLAQGAVGLVSTHDLALTAIPQEIGTQALNCHFADHLREDGNLGFDYKLYPGIVQTSNALALMRSIGIDV